MADTVISGDVRLPATVLIPDGDEVPLVVMVHGSGPLDRDETVMANKPFRDIAEGLAQKGIATLRYDKRTLVCHEAVASMDDETINDALSAIRLAHRHSGRVYLLGHSLGAMLAPIIAERAGRLLSGVIMMAAPARDLEALLQEQFDYLLPSGASDAYKQRQMEQVRQRSPHYLQQYGQVEAARRLSIPIMVLQGERDYQVTMDDFMTWQHGLGDKTGASFRSYPHLNHLFLHGEGMSTPMEYQMEGHVASYVVDDIASFVLDN